MAKKSDNLFLIAGIGIAGILLYEMMKPKAPTTVATALPVTTTPAASSTSGGLMSLLSSLSSILGGSSSSSSNLNIPPLSAVTPITTSVPPEDTSGETDITTIDPNFGISQDQPDLSNYV